MGSVTAASEVKTASSERRVDADLCPSPTKKAAFARVPGMAAMTRGQEDDGCDGGQGSRHFQDVLDV